MERTRAGRAPIVILLLASACGDPEPTCGEDASSPIDAGACVMPAPDGGTETDAGSALGSRIITDVPCDIVREELESVDSMSSTPDHDTEQRFTFRYAETRDARIVVDAIAGLFVAGCETDFSEPNGRNCVPEDDPTSGALVSCTGETALPTLRCRPIAAQHSRLTGGPFVNTVEYDDGVVRVLCGASVEEREELADGTWSDWRRRAGTPEVFSSVRVSVTLADD
jgi:hypothetical protein